MFFSALINRAAEFAAEAHMGQLRKSPESQVPYIHHPVMVGFILHSAGFDERVVAAGILHDVIEDTAYSFADLEDRFGRKVADLVNAVTEQDKSLPWEERKAKHLRELESASEEEKAIATADKIHNINSILLSLERGQDIWSAFKRGKNAQLDRFNRFIEMMKKDWSHSILEELENAVTKLEQQA